MLLHSRIADSLDALGGYWETDSSGKGLAAHGQNMDTDGLPSEQEWRDEVANVLGELQTEKVVSGYAVVFHRVT